MAFEYQALAIMTIFFLLAFIPSSVAKRKSYGMKWLLSNRDPLKDREMIPWGQRCERAHNNLKDNFPGFVVAILLLGAVGKFSNMTELLAGIYVVARLGHFIAYGIGNVPLRALTYFSGLIANIVLLIKVFC